MDRACLDRLARALAAVPTRRALTRWLVAALTAGGLGRVVAGDEPAAAARKKKPKPCKPACPVCQRCRRGRCKPTDDRLRCDLTDADKFCERGSCVPGRCGNGGPCRVFASSASRPGGEIGGLAGGDALCQSLADAAGLGGTYRAWLSAGALSPSNRFSNRGKAGPYVLVLDGDEGFPPDIANSFADLTTCDGDAGDCLLHAIDRNEFGVAVGTRCVWTGTLTDGSVNTTPDPDVFGDRTCRDWNDATNGSTGSTGGRDLKNSGWTNLDRGSCSFPCRLYCFEQA